MRLETVFLQLLTVPGFLLSAMKYRGIVSFLEPHVPVVVS